jgi:transcription-repair coupling factor (superfamily II helicase)
LKLRPVVDAFERSPAAVDLADRLPARGAAVRLGGLPGSSGSVLVASLSRRLPQRLLTVVAPTTGEAERWLADLSQLVEEGLALYPQREALGEDEPHYEIAGERAETIEALLQGRLRILVTTARATAERTLVPAALQRLRLRLAVSDRRAPASVAGALEEMGYQRVPTVTEVAEFSVRGGILDVYGFGMATPARLEWWGDDISSIRGFDLTTQRSLDELSEVTILPVSTNSLREAEPTDGRRNGQGVRRTLLELLPADTIVVEEAAGPDADEVARAWNEAEHHLEIARRLGEDLPSRAAIL